jgi:hypothetical protein
MSLRTPTDNESRQFPGHDFPSIVIPAQAGIQVCSRPISLDTRFRGYDGTQPLPRQLLPFRTRTFEGGHEGHEGSHWVRSRTDHSPSSAQFVICTCARVRTLFFVISYSLFKLFGFRYSDFGFNFKRSNP